MLVSLDKARYLAAFCGLEEVAHAYKQRKVSFASHDSDDRYRVDYYYTTGTVMTVLVHPKHDTNTQLVRRGIGSEEELQEIFENPRTHTGKGYYVREELKQRRMERVRQFRIARGRYFDGWLNGDVMDFVVDQWDEEVSCVALGDNCALLLYDGGVWAYSAGLPRGLYNKLRGRAYSHPKPTYCAMGSQGRYFIEFDNGHSQWSKACGDDFGEVIREKSERVTCVAFGEDDDSYCIIFADGSYYWKGIPTRISNILRSRDRRLPLVKSVSIGPNSDWYIMYENGNWRSQTNDRCSKDIRKLQRSGQGIKDVKFGEDGTYLIRYDDTEEE